MSILMGMVILVITGFQVYWLKDNYNRERKAVEVRTDALFQETVRQVQDSLLQQKLYIVLKDSSGVSTSLNKKLPAVAIKHTPPGQPNAARVINLITQTVVNDSLAKLNKKKNGVFITLKENGNHQRTDTSGKISFVLDSLPPEDIREVVVVSAGGNGRERRSAGDSIRAGRRFRNTEMLSIGKTLNRDSINQYRFTDQHYLF